MKGIDAELVHDKKKDHHADGDACCDPKDVDERENLALHQVSPRYFQIIFDHWLPVGGIKFILFSGF
jgi:hypothetical protein